MITTRNKALTKINELEKGLFNLIELKTDLTKEVSQIYLKKISVIRKNIIYFGEIAHMPSIHNPILGNINLKRITKFIEENSNY